jgi:hypothetical protein
MQLPDRPQASIVARFSSFAKLSAEPNPQVFSEASGGKQDSVALEPGLDLHEWETRWQELQDLAAESPAEAMPEVVRLIEDMLVARGYDLNDPVVVEGEDLLPNLLAARELVAACQAGTASPGDIAAALENLAEIHDHLVEDRAAP